MSKIHSTAIISPDSEIHPTVEIGPYSVVEEGVTVGEGCRIGPHCFLGRDTHLGKENELHFGVVLGDSPQYRGLKGPIGELRIGDRNVFREYVTVHRGSETGSATRIGSDNYLMAFSHLGHDCQIENRVTIVNGALLSGHTDVEDDAFISALAAVHQFVRIGKLAFVRGLARISKNPPPYFIADGESEVLAVNVEGLKRAGIPSEERGLIRKAFHLLYRSKLSQAEAITQIRSLGDSPHLTHLADFIENSERGICRYRARGK